MRTSPASLKTLLNIQAGEGQITALMFAYSFMWGITSVTFNTAAYAIFLTVFDASTMSLFYIGAAVVMTLSGLLYNRLSQKIAMPRLAFMASVALTVSIVAIWLGLLAGQPAWLVFFALIWNWVLWTINGLIFWSIAGQLFNLLQGKRLYGLIGAGEVVSGLIVGLLLPLLIPQIGVVNILLLAAFGFAGTSFMVWVIGRRYAARLVDTGAASENRRSQRKASQRTGQYVIWIMALAAIAIVGFYLVDYLFYSQVEIVYADQTKLASFLAQFVALTRLVNLVVRTVLSGRLLSRFGLRVGLLMLPVLLLVGIVVAIGTEVIAPQLMAFAIVMIISKAVDEVLRYTIDYPSYMILFQPVPPEQRASALSFSEGVVSPASGGIAGIILIVLASLLGMGITEIAIVSGIVLALWVGTALISHREYGQALRKAIQNRFLEGSPDLIEDRSNRDIILRLLNSKWHGEVIYAVDLLCQADDESLPAILEKLLDHPSTEVREDALIRIERLDLQGSMPAVQRVAKNDDSARVRGAAIRTWAALGETDAVDDIASYLDASEPLIRLGAMIGLLRHGGLEGTLIAGERLLSMTRSEEAAERSLSAHVLGAVGVKGFYRPLLPLMDDAEPAVRSTALKSAGIIQHQRLWEPIVNNLAYARYASTAVASLTAIGQQVTPDLLARFNLADAPIPFKIHVIRVLGQIGGSQAIEFLLNQLNQPDRRMRAEIHAALARTHRASAASTPVIRKQIEHEVRDAAWVLASLVDLTGSAHSVVLVRALERELELIRLRLFALLSMLYDPALITRIRESLATKDGDRQAYAAELLETLVTQDLRSLLLPVMHLRSPADSVRALSAVSPQPLVGHDQRLALILGEQGQWLNTWVIASAIFAAVRAGLKDQVPTAVKLLNHADPVIRETALWALSKLSPSQYASYADMIAGTTTDADIKLTIRTNLDAGRRGTEMLLTIEKVSILKGVSIFEGIPDDMLAQLAGLLEPEQAQAGETIIQRGELGSEMYIIVAGRLRVHVGDETLAELGERDIFGEMSLLDPGPRSASVTAMGDTYLLKLDRDVLVELMQEHIEVSQAIIRVLTNRLRTAVDLLNETQGQTKDTSQDIWGDLITNESGLHKRVERTRP